MKKLFPFSEKNLSLQNGNVTADFELGLGGTLSLTYGWNPQWPLKGFAEHSAGGSPQRPESIPRGELLLQRAPDLWRSTCFEAFLRPVGIAKYWEINLSPGGRWNAYEFRKYREPAPPQETVMFHLEKMEVEPGVLRAYLKMKDLKPDFEVGLCCVLETENGEKSYWSLKHPASKPDFHDPSGFVGRTMDKTK